MTGHTRNFIRILAVLSGAGWLHTPAYAETILFVGNSFTYGAQSAVQGYRPETVIDLNHDGMAEAVALQQIAFETPANEPAEHDARWRAPGVPIQ